MADAQNENLVLIDDAGVEHEFEILDVLEWEEQRYAVLYPVSQETLKDDEAIVMKLVVSENGEEMFEDIADDKEWERFVDAYEEMMAAAEQEE